MQQEGLNPVILGCALGKLMPSKMLQIPKSEFFIHSIKLSMLS